MHLDNEKSWRYQIEGHEEYSEQQIDIGIAIVIEISQY